MTTAVVPMISVHPDCFNLMPSNGCVIIGQPQEVERYPQATLALSRSGGTLPSSPDLEGAMNRHAMEAFG